MKINTIHTRDLARNMKKITQAVERGASYTVLRNAKPVFRIEPITNDTSKTVRLNLEELKKIQFKGPQNLSKKIDDIAYGI